MFYIWETTAQSFNLDTNGIFSKWTVLKKGRTFCGETSQSTV